MVSLLLYCYLRGDHHLAAQNGIGQASGIVVGVMEDQALGFRVGIKDDQIRILAWPLRGLYSSSLLPSKGLKLSGKLQTVYPALPSPW
jgi:hypothetical protein